MTLIEVGTLGPSDRTKGGTLRPRGNQVHSDQTRQNPTEVHADQTKPKVHADRIKPNQEVHADQNTKLGTTLE